MRTAPSSLLALFFATGLAAEPRTWTDRDGRTVKAELVRADATSVVIRRVGDGREFTLPRERLSTADLAHLDSLPSHAIGTAPAPDAHGPTDPWSPDQAAPFALEPTSDGGFLLRSVYEIAPEAPLTYKFGVPDSGFIR